MKSFSYELTEALNQKQKQPVWLMKIEFPAPGPTLYLADRAITIWGEDWDQVVIAWGAVDRFFDARKMEVQASDTIVYLDNRPGSLSAGPNNISWYFRKYDLSGATATLYMWLEGAGLTEPVGASQNDLITILTGRPELSGEITPRLCPLDIVSTDVTNADGAFCKWGDLLAGRYTLSQWPSIAPKKINKWKPALFGDAVVAEGLSLAEPLRTGAVTGPDSLFDHNLGSKTIEITFPNGGKYNSTYPFPAPCDIFVGDWRFTIQKSPTQSGAAWAYEIYGPKGVANNFIPTPLQNSTPMFAPASGLLWPTSADSSNGPYGSAEPYEGSPYQLYHGASDVGSSTDGHNPGRNSSRAIGSVYVDGVEATAGEVTKDHSFGIVWIKKENSSVVGKIGNPKKMRIKWTGVESDYTTGDAWLNAIQLTEKYPFGYHPQANPCMLGDFAIPASGGGAPASSRLGLVNQVVYPQVGVRIADVRFVLTYTGLETTSGSFNISLFGASYSFASSELDDGSGIIGAGWSVVKKSKGTSWEVWPNNDGYPINGLSPDPRYFDVYELSIDVTANAIALSKENGSFAQNVRLWFSGATWPDVNSMIVLGVELEIQYDPAESFVAGPRVTAIINTASSTAGEILAEIIPSSDIGVGFNDATLPPLKYLITKQQSVCRFVKTVVRDSNTELIKNGATGKYDLVKKSSTRNNAFLPPATGGVAVINQGDMLVDENGEPMFLRTRSTPEAIVNEVTLHYLDEDGKTSSVTQRDEGSISAHGVKRYSADTGASMSGSSAQQRALDILNENSEFHDFYSMTFDLGSTMALEPNDVLEVSAILDSLSAAKMRVVSVEVNPGDIAGGRISTVTINALRYSKARKGYGEINYGQAGFGLAEVVDN